ncbi:MAG: HNH endonuclease signature motif containing protein [Oscillospiraceae bacterium]|nr:HNH endonuclease signature motif containing protein [Oscillospiraceae bacterium]
MLKACQFCGRIHAKDYDCGKRPKRTRYARDEREAGRYTSAFAAKSREIKERASYLCEVCIDKGRLSYEGVEVHHISKLRDRPDLLLDDANLVCLCQRCHRRADRGEIDADYLRDLAQRRDEDPPGV